MNEMVGYAGIQDLFGDSYQISRIEEEDGQIIIHIKSIKSQEVCPDCGEMSSSLHATYKRYIQDTPIRNKQTWLHVSVHKFDCENPLCESKVITEELPFAGGSQVRTFELSLMALEIARNLGNETASQVLSSLGVKMSNDTIARIYDDLEVRQEATYPVFC